MERRLLWYADAKPFLLKFRYPVKSVEMFIPYGGCEVYQLIAKDIFELSHIPRLTKGHSGFEFKVLFRASMSNLDKWFDILRERGFIVQTLERKQRSK